MRSRPIPVRFDEEMIDRIDDAGKLLHVSRSVVLRMAIANQLREIEAGYIKLRQNPCAQKAKV